MQNLEDPELKLTPEQKANMVAFLQEKRKIVEQGEMKEQHFVRMAELGFGNGGVVLKVEHKPTGITMARKVCTLCHPDEDLFACSVLHSPGCKSLLAYLLHFLVHDEVGLKRRCGIMVIPAMLRVQ